MGQAVVRDLTTSSGFDFIAFTSQPASAFPGGVSQVTHAVVEQHTWVAVVGKTLDSISVTGGYLNSMLHTVNSGASDRLQASYANPNSSYDGADAITVYADEARNENALYVVLLNSRKHYK